MYTCAAQLSGELTLKGPHTEYFCKDLHPHPLAICGEQKEVKTCEHQPAGEALLLSLYSGCVDRGISPLLPSTRGSLGCPFCPLSPACPSCAPCPYMREAERRMQGAASQRRSLMRCLSSASSATNAVTCKVDLAEATLQGQMKSCRLLFCMQKALCVLISGPQNPIKIPVPAVKPCP